MSTVATAFSWLFESLMECLDRVFGYDPDERY